jgi:hypothetical protein
MEVFGYNETIAAIEEEAAKIVRAAEAQMRLAGQALANDIKELSPYLTGTYRRSIHVEAIVQENGKFYAIVGTDLPQAKRLEFGFYDMTDSLGRHYYQYPLPHFRPPLDQQMGKYVAIMQNGLDQWLESAELAGRSGMIYSAGSMASSASSTSSRSRLASIGGTMQGDFGGYE